MANITAAEVNKLRKMTGAGMMDCKKALVETEGDFEKAIKYLTRAIELVPDDPIMLEHLGDAYLKVNDKDNALKFYQKSLQKKETEKDKEALMKKIRELYGNDS